MIGWLLLVAVVSGAVCFTIGHRTARIRIIPIGAILDQDQTAIAAEEVDRFWQIVDGLDLDQPDDPRSST